jgi:hypothetical protein
VANAVPVAKTDTKTVRDFLNFIGGGFLLFLRVSLHASYPVTDYRGTRNYSIFETVTIREKS